MGLVCWPLVAGPLPCRAEDWPQFRGPDGQGHSIETGLPAFGAEDATTSPGKRRSRASAGRRPSWRGRSGLADHRNRRIRHARWRSPSMPQSGTIVRDVEVFHKPDLGRISHKNSHASPTPVLEATGSTSTSARTAPPVWMPRARSSGKPCCSTIIATARPVRRCFGTICCSSLATAPIINISSRWTRRPGQALETKPPGRSRLFHAAGHSLGAEEQLISVGGGAVVACRPKSGAEIWRCRFDGHSSVPRPVYGGGLLYVCTGLWTPSLYAPARRRSRRRDQYPRGGALAPFDSGHAVAAVGGRRLVSDRRSRRADLRRRHSGQDAGTSAWRESFPRRRCWPTVAST